jgi:hypothetical protein
MNTSLTVAAVALLSAFAGDFFPLPAQTKPPSPGAACASVVEWKPGTDSFRVIGVAYRPLPRVSINAR